MVDHRRRDEWSRRGTRRSPDASEEPDDEQALRDLQQQAGNRAVSGALTSMRDGEAATTGSRADSPGLRLLAAFRSGSVHVQRQAVGGMLRRGMRGPEVEALQADLGRAGYALAVDGIFGPATQAAVVTFQQRAGLAADGIVGPATRGALASGGKVAGKGSVDKEPWAPTEEEVAAKEKVVKEEAVKEQASKDTATKEGSAKDGASIEQEPWAPTEEEVAAKEKSAKEGSAKDGASIEQEPWAPTDEEAETKDVGTPELGKDAASTEKDDWWLA